MRKVILFIAMSLDGYIADREGGVDWLGGHGDDSEMRDTYSEFIVHVDTVVMGRNTYDQIVTELSPDEWVYRDLISYVITRREVPASAENIRFLAEDPCRLIRSLREKEGKAIWICGGAELVQQLWKFAMSSFIYAGSMQYVGVGLIAGGASVVTAILTTIMVNARHLFYSISMIERYKDTGKYKPYLIFSLTDETYSLLCDGQVPEEASGNRYRFFVSFFNQCYWVAGSVIGSLLGSVLPFSTEGIEFSMTALFIASFTEQWLSGGNHIPALTGFLCSLLCLVLFGPEHFLIPAMLLITLVLTAVQSRIRMDREGIE